MAIKANIGFNWYGQGQVSSGTFRGSEERFGLDRMATMRCMLAM